MNDRRAIPSAGGSPLPVQVCSECNGLWLDGTVLSAICPTLSNLSDRREEVALVGAPGGGIETCPGCAATPFEVEIIGVKIDFCITCRGVWLDGDEYEETMLSVARAEPVVEAGRRGPYRSAIAKAARTGEVDCVGCRLPARLERTYMSETGLICGQCHFANEQRKAELRAAISMGLEQPVESPKPLTLLGRAAGSLMKGLLTVLEGMGSASSDRSRSAK